MTLTPVNPPRCLICGGEWSSIPACCPSPRLPKYATDEGERECLEMLAEMYRGSDEDYGEETERP